MKIPTHSSTFQKMLFNILLLITALSITFICLEFGWRFFINSGGISRVWHPELVLVNPPNKQWTIRNTEFTTHMRSNSVGYRGPEMPKEEKGENELRVLFLGDSFLEAAQVEESERFADLVGDKLSSQLEQLVTVRSLGVAKYDPATELLVYRNLGRTFEPDVVIQVLFPENDLTPKDGPYRFTKEGEHLRLEDIWVEPQQPCPWKCQILSRSRLAFHSYLFLRDIRRRTQGAVSENEYSMYTNEGYKQYEDADRFGVLAALVRALRNDVEIDGAEFFTVLMPGAFEVQNNWRKDWVASTSGVSINEWQPSRLIDTVKTGLESIGIVALDVRPVLLDADPDTVPVYYRTNAHLNIRGNILVADAITTFLLSTLY